MADWNDVLTVLTHDPDIRHWEPFPGAARTATATAAPHGHPEATLILDNTANDLWLQILSPASPTSDGPTWEAAGWFLRDLPAVGLAQIGDGIAIRHAILLPHATIHAITNGIALTAIAAAALANPAH
ncbi:hypothetical protein GCM10012320_32850 [Sinomonas cellulolyticus]|uniref:Uncharacterized protein n=1 Tax=Sinomonas cellulolyticus TaxID=2801916 RepID=A0ABS1JXC2_9MICC|nr:MULTISPECIES: hypothetical protein [Sinomonas]MBL0703979.1 hypothetical protein [Sinomonas cellulolyticus]GHG59001.1 hypothetical protein GCM10012320_32850 [Sinomonas sp. KCTC 49339]